MGRLEDGRLGREGRVGGKESGQGRVSVDVGGGEGVKDWPRRPTLPRHRDATRDWVT